MSRFSRAMVIAMAGLMALSAPLSAAAATQATWTAADQTNLNSLNAYLAKQQSYLNQQAIYVKKFQDSVDALNKTIADSINRIREIMPSGGDPATMMDNFAKTNAERIELYALIDRSKFALARIQGGLRDTQANLDSYTASVAYTKTEIAALEATRQLAAQDAARQLAAQQEAARKQEAARVAKANAIAALTSKLLYVRTTGQVVDLVNAAAQGDPPLTKVDVIKAMNDAMAGVGMGGWRTGLRTSLINPVRVLVENSKTTGDAIITLAISANSKVAAVGVSGATGANGVTGDTAQPAAGQTITTAVYIG